MGSISRPWRARALTSTALACAALALLAAGCGRGESWPRAEGAPARRLVGTWEVRYRVARTGRDSAGPEVRGALALLSNHWVSHDYPLLDVPTHYGSYDVDFRPAGFEPRSGGAIPEAAAVTMGRDSVAVVLEPADADASVEMRGAWVGDSLVGVWRANAGRGGTAASGRFVMTRRRAD